MFVANGMEKMTEREIRQLLPELKRSSPGGIWLKFYGPGDCHDRIAGRNGDFDQLMMIARLAGEHGLTRHESVPLSKSTVERLPELMEELDSLSGSFQRYLYLSPYRSHAKWFEKERPTEGDVLRIPEHIRPYLRNGSVKPHRTESEWIERILAGGYTRKTVRYYVLPVWEDNIERLEASDCEGILSDIREQDDRTYRAIPTIQTLAEMYGSRNGKKLYWGRDLEWKWIDLHLKAHPEIDPNGKFDDLRPTILWR